MVSGHGYDNDVETIRADPRRRTVPTAITNTPNTLPKADSA